MQEGKRRTPGKEKPGSAAYERQVMLQRGVRKSTTPAVGEPPVGSLGKRKKFSTTKLVFPPG